MNKFIDALYDENRNAIPSWQGYHYQGQAAVVYFLEYILKVFKTRPADVYNVSVKIEWMEDFVIMESDNIKEIYQVKKTMDSSNYKDVIENFMIEHKISGDNEFTWKAIYNDYTKEEYLKITEEYYNKIYKEYIEDEFIYQIEKLIENKNKLSYWSENLKRGKESELKKVRGYVGHFIKGKNLKEEDCVGISETILKPLLGKLQKKDTDYDLFQKQCSFEQLKIDEMENKLDDLVNELVKVGCFEKSSVIENNQIIDLLYIMIYESLMNLKNGKKDGEKFVITSEMVKKVFYNKEMAEELWKKDVYEIREEILEQLKEFCERDCVVEDKSVLSEDCATCVFSEFRDLNIMNLVDNCNLHLPKFSSETAKKSWMNKLSEPQQDFLINTLCENRNDLKCKIERSSIELNKKNKCFYISQIISGSGRAQKRMKENIIENIWDHIDVYKDYDNIFTKEYDDDIDYRDIKIIKDHEKISEEFKSKKRNPTFFEIPLIKFVSQESVNKEENDE